MEQELVRTGLNGSALVDLLAQLALIEPPVAAPSFVEGMGRWLGWKEAIPLSAVLQPTAPGMVAAVSDNADALQHQLSRMQAELTQAILAERDTAQEDGHDFLPFRRRCLNLQQTMQAALGPLREQLRAAVAQQSLDMAKLAALDAVMARALAPREQALLAMLPVLLEQHFLKLRAAPFLPRQKPWLDTFRQDMHRLLLAELNLRLQPSLGLLETLHSASQGLHE